MFGWSPVHPDGSIRIPAEAAQEYHLEPEEKVILISGSRTSGGCVVAKKALLEKSALASVLAKNPELDRFSNPEGETIPFKGRRYCWIALRQDGVLKLPPCTLESFSIRPANHLLSIRGSSIAFVMAQKGPLVTKAAAHPEVPVFP